MKREWKEAVKKFFYECITANTRAISQHVAHTTDQLILPAAKQEPYQKKPIS